MKFSINQNELQEALGVVSKASTTRAALPILSGVLLRAANDSLTLEATDLNLSIRSTLPALIEEEGEALVPASLLVNIVKKLPDAAVHISSDEENITILCDTTSMSLRTLIAQDFPAFPEIAPEQAVDLPFELFSRMAKKVEKVVSTDESRPIFSGVLVDVSQGYLKLVATDSYRLSLIETEFNNPAEDFSSIVPGTFMRDISSLTQEEETIQIGFNENQIIVSYSGCTFITRKIEGTFPDYNQLIPKNCGTSAVIDTRQLIDAVDRTSLLSNKTMPVKFDLNNASQTIQLLTSAQDIGTASETIGAQIEGDDIEIGFNHTYILEGLRAAETETITLELDNSQRPGIFRAEGQEKYTYMIMPVRV